MKSSAIAIVGMAGRFPLARNVGEFWRNLCDGVESIRRLSDAELLAAGVSPDVLAQPEYVKAAAVLHDVDMFDASFFGFSPRDAAIMDPQHRHFLECAWEAVENSGHLPESFSDSIGVFAGSGMNSYLIHNLINNHRLMDSAGLFLIRQTGNDKDVLATRVSYQLDLRGPSLSVQTACSSSLVAVHLACQSLLGCECDMALAGGVTIEIPHSRGYVYREGEILSRDGHCRAFDSASSGTVFSSGVGIVVLRRLDDAIADGDTIHAVILGSAVNNDGQRKVGFLAPSVAGQAEVIAEALGVAGVSAETISYVETHGTGTTVGDPLEIKALTQAFRADTARTGYCAIGSLKTNVGHLDAAAGVAGLMKAVLALEHRQLPASLHFKNPNPQIDFQNSPFYVNTSLQEWPGGQTPRRAGVTSLGIGGTNVHVVLEEAPAQPRKPSARPHHLIPLSAKTETALDEMAARLATHLRDNPDLRLADVAFTAQVGRKAFPHRRIVVAGDAAEAALVLGAAEARPGFTGSASSRSRSIAFLFSGQGSQYVNMGAELYANEPIFRASFDRCADELRGHLGLDLREIVYPNETNAAWAAAQLNRTGVTQPALFSLEYSLAQWWISLGVAPQAMIGHSIGEYVAACLAGVFSLEDALAITSIRGQLMEECAPGAMLAVALAAEEIPESSNLSIAAINSPRQCVVSGPVAAVAELERRFTERGVPCHPLRTSHAFHSPMMEPILDSFLARMREVSLAAPGIPYLSNLTGRWITASEATDPLYWVEHLRKTVKFSDCVTELLREPGRLMIEIGPGQTLASLVRQHMSEAAGGKSTQVCISVRRREETAADTAILLKALGQVWLAGQAVDWSALHAGEKVMRIPLPTYAFQRQRFWIEPDNATLPQEATANSRPAQPAAAETVEKSRSEEEEQTGQNGIDDWFYERAWRRTEQPKAASLPETCWIVFRDSTGLGKQITRHLRKEAHRVIEVTPGDGFKRTDGRHYSIRPGAREDYDALLNDLNKRQISPTKVIHLWTVNARNSHPSLEEKLELSFYSLLFLAQALVQEFLTSMDVIVVSSGIWSVAGEAVTDPVAATAMGPVRVLPKEFPGITCRNIDIDSTAKSSAQAAREIIAELSGPGADPVVALRHGKRWIEGFERCERTGIESGRKLRRGGVYLITGGLGDLGLAIADDLARRFQARLVLIGRTPLPQADNWESTLADASAPERLKQRIRKLMEIESHGAKVTVLSCDVCDLDEMKRAIKNVLLNYGSINGVIHAAGAIEDSSLQLKSRESAKRVLGPKVKGTLVLSEVLQGAVGHANQGAQLDFLALFSSVSSVLGPAGQVDYTAANAFLDAFAHAHRDSGIVAINWAAWRDVGMAARTSRAHPLLARWIVDTEVEVVCSASLNYDRDWVLTEHRRPSGRAVLPGTCYLEMAVAALTRGALDLGVEFEDVFFHSPLMVEPGQTRDARVILRGSGDGAFQFSVRARDSDWVVHASGQISRRHRSIPSDRSIDEMISRCNSRYLTFDDKHRTEQERFFDFGPRWRCLKAIHVGANEALAELELHPSFAGDVADYLLHPALLDLATGSALYLIENYGTSASFYFPMFYKRAVFYRRIPSRFLSHICSRERNEASDDVATFDLTLLDESGKLLAEITGFSMRQIFDPDERYDIPADRVSASESSNGKADERWASGITPQAGTGAFLRVVSSARQPGIFVLPDGLLQLSGPPEKEVRATRSGLPSSDAVEVVLSGWWQELLGLDRIDQDDDFFDLGGHSLLIIRLLNMIKKTYGVTLGLSTLFEARTIRMLARLIEVNPTNVPTESSAVRAIVAIQRKGRRLPLFVMSGLTGDVIEYHRLSFYLGEDQPVFGLLPRGRDGIEAFDTTVEDIAAYYVETIRKMQAEGPYRLVGHSFGGTVAFEVARQMVAQNAVVSFLGLFDTIEWHYRERAKKSLALRERLAIYSSELKLAMADREPFGPLWKRCKRKFTKTISPLVRALGRPLPPPAQGIEDVNEHAGATYQPTLYPGKLTLFRSNVRRTQDGHDEYLGWGSLVAGGIEIHHVPSDHYTIVREPSVKFLAEKLRECLDRDNVVTTEELQHASN